MLKHSETMTYKRHIQNYKYMKPKTGKFVNIQNF